MSRPITLIAPDELRQMLAEWRVDEYTLLDVRQQWEYVAFHLPGAELIPLPELPDSLSELNREQPLVVYCHTGIRSAAAADLLAGQGFARVFDLGGGIAAWRGETARPADLPVGAACCRGRYPSRSSLSP